MNLPSREAIVSELCKRDYHKYVEHVHGNMFKDGSHIRYITERVQAFLEDTDSNVNIQCWSLPPQHGKSMTITETLPSWYNGNNPDDGVIVLSYGDDLAKKFGKKNKNKFKEYALQIFGLELAKDQQSILNYGIEGYRGFSKFAGIMAGVTGNNADLIIIDDPIKNRKEAESDTYRASLKQEFEDTVLSRLSAKGKVIIIQTRWHTDDLIGYVTKNFPDKCEYINIPLEAEENDILGRNIGDALFPEIGKDNEWLKEKKKMYITDSGVRSWESLYQGHPVVQSGNIIKRKWLNFITKDQIPGIKYVAGKPVDYYAGMDYLTMSIDATFKGNDDNDRVAINVMGKRGIDYYVFKVLADRLDFVATLNAIRVTNSKFPNLQAKYIEDKANGPAIISMLRKEIEGIIAINPEGDKISRAYSIQHLVESGHVYIVIDEWTEDFVLELTGFPYMEHDDMVDAFTQNMIRLSRFYTEIRVPEKKDDFEKIFEKQRQEENQDTVIRIEDFF